jgi:hypothetical protein
MAFATGIAAAPGDIARNSAVSEGWSGVLVSGLSLLYGEIDNACGRT